MVKIYISSEEEHVHYEGQEVLWRVNKLMKETWCVIFLEVKVAFCEGLFQNSLVLKPI